jgi:hypothetical protein
MTNHLYEQTTIHSGLWESPVAVAAEPHRPRNGISGTWDFG